MQAFDGTTFFFHGEPGKFYNLASAAGEFQVGSYQLLEALVPSSGHLEMSLQ